MEIKPTIGFDNLLFGTPKQILFKILGSGEELGDYKDGRESFSFKNGSIDLLFDGELGLIAITVNSCNEYQEVLLWNEKIFKLSEAQILDSIERRKLNYTREEDGFGEIDIVVEDLGMLIFMDDEGLQSVEIYDRNNPFVWERIQKQKTIHNSSS